MSVQIYERKISCTTLASIELVPMSLKLIQVFFAPFKRQSHKMAKHTQTTLLQIADELFECVWPLC